MTPPTGAALNLAGVMALGGGLALCTAAGSLPALAWALACVLDAWRRRQRMAASAPMHRFVTLALQGVLLGAGGWSVLSGADAAAASAMSACLLVLVVYIPTTAGDDDRAAAAAVTPPLIALAVAQAWRGWPGLVVVAAGAGAAALAWHHFRAARRAREREATDLRQARALRADLHAAREEATLAERSKARFLAAASHDLRQPLHALAVNATTLQLIAPSVDHPVLQGLSTAIGRSLAQSDHLLDSLLDLARLDAGATAPSPEVFDPATVMEDLRLEFTPQALAQALELQVRCEASCSVRTDRELLARILRNLLSNALKFTPAGGRVAFEGRLAGTECLFLVKDTGPGIPHEMQERVFEEFFQLANPSRDRAMGLGLGLSIVRRLARLLGLAVQLDSPPGQGACFSVRVPVADAPTAATSPSTGILPTLHGECVLVIDDERDVLYAFEQLLPQLGAEVHTAASAAQAEALIERGCMPSVLIVDIRLGAETGWDALARLRARWGPLPAMMLTGDHVEGSDRLRDDQTLIARKPLDGFKIAASLHQLLSRPPPSP